MTAAPATAASASTFAVERSTGISLTQRSRAASAPPPAAPPRRSRGAARPHRTRGPAPRRTTQQLSSRQSRPPCPATQLAITGARSRRGANRRQAPPTNGIGDVARCGHCPGALLGIASTSRPRSSRSSAARWLSATPAMSRRSASASTPPSGSRSARACRSRWSIPRSGTRWRSSVMSCARSPRRAPRSACCSSSRRPSGRRSSRTPRAARRRRRQAGQAHARARRR